MYKHFEHLYYCPSSPDLKVSEPFDCAICTMDSHTIIASGASIILTSWVELGGGESNMAVTSVAACVTRIELNVVDWLRLADASVRKVVAVAAVTGVVRISF